MNIRAISALGASLYLGMSGIAFAATAERSPAGTLRDGTAAEVIELKGKNGVSARILTYGATLQSLIAPDRKGKKADVVLGHDTVQEYEAKQDFFGVTVGRFANRIAKGRFTLDGKSYQLPLNNGANTLHGGGNGFDRKNWVVQSVTSGANASVVLSAHQPRWRQRLSRRSHRHGHLCARRQGQPDHFVRRDHHQTDDHQHDQPCPVQHGGALRGARGDAATADHARQPLYAG